MQAKLLSSPSDYDTAVAEIERLWGSAQGSADGDMLDLLMLLVEDYEGRNAVPLSSDPIALLLAHMEATGQSQSDLAGLFGSASRASEVLRRKRALSKDQIYRLHTEWRLPAELLITPYDLEVA